MSNPIQLVSWNINSVRLRLPLIKKLTETRRVDVLCLQETKVMDELFPADDLRAMGFEHLAFAGQKSYNGVAILSKIPLKNIENWQVAGFDDKRHISAELPNGTRLHNFYVPAGGDIPDIELNPKFDHKLKFLGAMTDWSKALDATQKQIIVGDFNIAPHEQDVWSHKQLLKVVSHTPIETDGLKALQAHGWIDTHREFTPLTEKLYSWWSYRGQDWDASDRGRRLDHIWLTAPLKDTLKEAWILREARGWEQPSDHVPIGVGLGL